MCYEIDQLSLLGWLKVPERVGRLHFGADKMQILFCARRNGLFTLQVIVK